MARIEKTVFISYRRTDVYTALAVYENLKNQGYDVFFDYRSIPSGDFEQIITENIKARAHFLIILTPTALDRCSEDGDFLRYEIELAIDEKRNVVPLFFKGFRFGTPAVKEKLTGKLENISRYNGLNVHEDYFEEAMQRVRTQFLSKPLDTVLHPVSTEVQKAVKDEQTAADEALKQKEERSELERLKSQAIQYELRGDLYNALQTYYKIKRLDPLFPSVDLKIKQLEKELQPEPVARTARVSEKAVGQQARSSVFPWRLIAGLAGGIAVIALLAWGGISLWNNLLSSTPALGIGSTMISDKDGMTLFYVPVGEFTMGSDTGSDDEKPVHKVNVDAFWIDETEVTNAMFSKFANETGYKTDAEKAGKSYVYKDGSWQYVEGADWSHPLGTSSGISDMMDHPVVHVSWNDAQAYCTWADRRLPTEAEWEKAASWDATDQQKYVYPWGNEFDGSRLNFCDKNCSFSWADKNSDDRYEFSAPVGSYPNGASPYRALDMAGNVWEWVNDWYDSSYYQGSPSSNPQGPSSGQSRVLRGGSWSSINYDFVRSAYRSWIDPALSYGIIGFRCASSP